MSNEDLTEIFTADKFTNMRRQVHIHEREMPSLTGRLAIKLAEHFGVVAAKPDGYDEAGRQKLALLPASEVVDRSITIAELMADGLRARGHIVILPSLKDDPEAA